jgi:hypothetical protein
MSIQLKTALETLRLIEPVCVHFRVGDLKEKRVNREILSSDYFLEILDREEFRKKEVWVFTDTETDEHVRDLVKKTEARIVSNMFQLTASEEFYLLMHSKSLVCANSTFSFMAASLGQIDCVVVPDIPEFENVQELFPHWEVRTPIYRKQ